MPETLYLHPSVAIPLSVHAVLKKSSDDLVWILMRLRGAKNVEWVSDMAPLYFARLDQIIGFVHVVRHRIEAADNAVRTFERSE